MRVAAFIIGFLGSLACFAQGLAFPFLEPRLAAITLAPAGFWVALGAWGLIASAAALDRPRLGGFLLLVGPVGLASQIRSPELLTVILPFVTAGIIAFLSPVLSRRRPSRRPRSEPSLQAPPLPDASPPASPGTGGTGA